MGGLGHDVEVLPGQAQPSQLHAGSHHDRRLPEANLMGQQGRAVLNHPPDSVLLVLVELPCPLGVHPRQCEMGAVEHLWAHVVERLVVVGGQPVSPFGLVPYPALELLLDCRGLLLGGDRFLGVPHRPVVDLVGHFDGLAVEKPVDDLCSG